MYICVCNQISLDEVIEQAINKDCEILDILTELSFGTDCGTCCADIKQIKEFIQSKLTVVKAS